ncbi:MAG TPA: VWA domain-containing protein [Blastocatellia bacterium]|nr:VWA domain-containing protein [Blastocatellia bacterium]
MISNRLTVLIVLLSLVAQIAGQQSSTQPPKTDSTQKTTQKPPQPVEEMVQLSTTLVQIDAVVTDKDGHQVTDLRPEEFEVLEDGKPQKITHFSYITRQTSTDGKQVVAARVEKREKDKFVPAPPPPHLNTDQAHRTLAIVVDDISMSFESIANVRNSLKKFIEEQMQPDDLVTIIRTRNGVGALQQFTNDKRQLLAAIDRLRWNPQANISAFMPVGSDAGPDPDKDPNATGPDASHPSSNADYNDFKENLFSVGTLGALNMVVLGMRELPGRKSILLVSDGMKIFGTFDDRRILDNMRRLTDLANRASVVIYSMDARGLPYLGPTAADDFNAGSSRTPMFQRLNNVASQRSHAYFDSQEGLSYLANQTGGFFVHNSNDLTFGAKRVLDDQNGYYLLGYEPDDQTFKPIRGSRPFHRLTVRVKRKGLHVRSRTGFYAITDEESNPVPHTAGGQILKAFFSPFTANGLNMRLTGVFNNYPDAGSVIQSLLYLDATGLTFTKEDDGWMKTVLDVLAVTFGENGEVVDQISKTERIRVRPDTYDKLLHNGLLYSMQVPVKKPGAYQLRVVMRDSVSERVGLANQYIDVPNLGKKRLTLSGMVISGFDPKPTAKPQQPSANSAGNPGDQGSDDSDPQASPAVRKLKVGMKMDFEFRVFNALLDPTDSKPHLKTQLHLFKDGKEVFTGKWQPYSTGKVSDSTRLTAGGTLTLGRDLAPGDYVVEIVVVDELAKEKQNSAVQWTDFEIVH